MPHITSYLSNIVNSVLLIQDFLLVWKHTPVPKDKKVQYLSDLRPTNSIKAYRKTNDITIEKVCVIMKYCQQLNLVSV